MGFTLSWRCILIIDLVMILIGIATFMKGFFPLKRHLPGYAEAGNGDNSSTIKLKLVSQMPHYDKVVIVLIDALRADFVLNHSTPMKYVQTMMDRGKTLSYIVKANPPTVTLPRIKALTTGSIPGFVDVVMNFDSAALMEDNIITQMKREGKRILFFGDDTWITLFPNHFVRSDGTTSFFVSDYTEVDHNVSRHLSSELQSLDWDVMILHYLGLDHIGHLAGPKSPLVKPKLQEMDDVIHKIYSALEKETTVSSLILICGDHGMSDQGSHGGASVSEVTVPAVFLSPSFSNILESSQGEIIQQIDLPPTLGVLLGIPIPKNNLGSVVTSALVGYSKEEVLWSLHSNAEQIVKLFEANFENYDTDRSFELYRLAVQEHSEWLEEMKSHGDSPAVDEKGRSITHRYKLAIQTMTARISSSLTMYDMYSMITAVILLWLVLIKYSMAKLKNLTRNEGLQISRHSVSLIMVSIPLVGFCHVTICTSHSRAESFLCGANKTSILLQLTVFVGLIFQVVVLLSIVLCSVHKPGTKKNSFCWFLFTGTVCHTFSLLSSSFVEEEHQTWYFITMTFHILLLVKIFTTKMVQKAKRSEKNETSGEEITESYSKLSQQKSHDNCSSYFRQENSGVNFYERKFQTCHKPSPDIRDFVSSPDEKEEEKYNEKERKKDGYFLTRYADPLGSTWNTVLGVLAVLILSRALRSLSQTGNKWLDRPDIGDWLTRPENKVWLSVAVIVSLATVLASIWGASSWLDRTLLLIGCFGVYRYRANTGDLIFFETPSSKTTMESWLVYAVIFMYFFKSLNSSFKLPSIISSDTSAGSKTPSQYSLQSPDTLHCLHSQCKSDSMLSVEDMSSVQHHGRQQPLLDTSLSLQNFGIPPTPQNHARPEPNFRIPESPQSQVAPCSQQSTGRIYSLQVIHNCWILLMTLLMRPHNVTFVAMVTVQETLVERYLLGHMTLSTSGLTLYCLWMGEASFFYQGNSNSISTVDVSAGYVGLMEYQPVLVGMLLSLATYAGPIFWLLALVKYIHAKSSCPTASLEENKARFGKEFTKVVHTLILTRALLLAAYTVLVTAQRYHLFVWTVFSPKLLFEGMFTVVIAIFSMVVLLICQ